MINLIGLFTDFACTLLIYLWVNDELGVDKFREKDNRLFKVTEYWQFDENTETSGDTEDFAKTVLMAIVAALPLSSYVTKKLAGQLCL